MADVELSTLGPIIKTAYEAEANTNAFNDAAVSKLAGIEAGAEVNDPVEGTDILSTGEVGGTKYLREDGDGTCSWQTVVGGSGAMTLLGSDTVVGAAATTMTVSGFDISDYQELILVGKLKNATGSNTSISLYYNSDTTATNYHRQTHTVDHSTTTGNQGNDGVMFVVVASGLGNFDANVALDVDGKARASGVACEGVGVAIIGRSFWHLWTTAAAITSITLSASVASSLDVGSTFTVYGIT